MAERTRVQVRALRPIVHADGETETVVPQGMTGTLFGASRVYQPTKQPRTAASLALAVWWDAVAIWASGPDVAHADRVRIATGWEDMEVPQDAIEAVAVLEPAEPR